MYETNYFTKLKRETDASINIASECLQNFDIDKDGYLNKEEFNLMLSYLFSSNNQTYELIDSTRQKLFDIADNNKVGKVSVDSLRDIWRSVIEPVYAPKCCLLVVDVQNDFISGTLALSACPAKQDGEQVVPVINQLIKNVEFPLIVYTQDWHPPDHCSFIDNVDKHTWRSNVSDSGVDPSAPTATVFDTLTLSCPHAGDIEQKLWPAHCVQHSWGAQLHKDLVVADAHMNIRKGTEVTRDCYSAFKDVTGKCSELSNILEQRNVSHVFVAGLAYDVCVAATARDAVECGFVTYIIDDACRGVTEDGVRDTKVDLERRGAILIHSNMVRDIVEGENRHAQVAEVLINRL